MDVTQHDVDRAFRIARWYGRKVRRAEVSDLESAALEGLAKAVDRFDGRGNRDRFWRYAATRILSEIRDELRRLDHLTRDQRADVSEFHDGSLLLEEMPWLNPQEPLPLDAETQDEDGEHRAIVALIPDPRDRFADAENRDGLERGLRLLDDRERLALIAVDYLGVQNDQIAAGMNVTAGRSTQLRTKASEKMRAALGQDFLLAA